MMKSLEKLRMKTQHFWGDALSTWKEGELEGPLTTDVASYLREVGLPMGVDWTLDFSVRSRRAGQPGGEEQLFVIGRDGQAPICIDEARGGVIVCDERDLGGGVRFVNSSIDLFGYFLTIYQRYRLRVREAPETQIDAIIKESESEMQTIDADALSNPETYWSVVIEQMKDGLL